MIVLFRVREPGNHRPIYKADMGAVPREGDSISIRDAAYTVHAVRWIIHDEDDPQPPYADVLVK